LYLTAIPQRARRRLAEKKQIKVKQPKTFVFNSHNAESAEKTRRGIQRGLDQPQL
jgi:hypothetical protein